MPSRMTCQRNAMACRDIAAYGLTDSHTDTQTRAQAGQNTLGSGRRPDLVVLTVRQGQHVERVPLPPLVPRMREELDGLRKRHSPEGSIFCEEEETKGGGVRKRRRENLRREEPPCSHPAVAPAPRRPGHAWPAALPRCLAPVPCPWRPGSVPGPMSCPGALAPALACTLQLIARISAALSPGVRSESESPQISCSPSKPQQHRCAYEGKSRSPNPYPESQLGCPTQAPLLTCVLCQLSESLRIRMTTRQRNGV